MERTSRAPKEDGRADQVAKFQRRFQPTLGEIESDKLTKLSNEYWAPHTERTHKPYDPAVIEDIYNSELNHRESQRRIMLLEYSQYLENYLWPNLKAESLHGLFDQPLPISCRITLLLLFLAWHVNSVSFMDVTLTVSVK